MARSLVRSTFFFFFFFVCVCAPEPDLRCEVRAVKALESLKSVEAQAIPGGVPTVHAHSGMTVSIGSNSFVGEVVANTVRANSSPPAVDTSSGIENGGWRSAAYGQSLGGSSGCEDSGGYRFDRP